MKPQSADQRPDAGARCAEPRSSLATRLALVWHATSSLSIRLFTGRSSPGCRSPQRGPRYRTQQPYVKSGGTVIFDTRDAFNARPDESGQARRDVICAACWRTLDVPELERFRLDHVLTKTFYLLDDFPGRYATGPDLGRGPAPRR